MAWRLLLPRFEFFSANLWEATVQHVVALTDLPVNVLLFSSSPFWMSLSCMWGTFTLTFAIPTHMLWYRQDALVEPRLELIASTPFSFFLLGFGSIGNNVELCGMTDKFTGFTQRLCFWTDSAVWKTMICQMTTLLWDRAGLQLRCLAGVNRADVLCVASTNVLKPAYTRHVFYIPVVSPTECANFRGFWWNLWEAFSIIFPTGTEVNLSKPWCEWVQRSIPK